MISSFTITAAQANWEEVPSFNLVIEVLLISSSRSRGFSYVGGCRFNLVIEVLLISSHKRLCRRAENCQRFNLVIEVLLISSHNLAVLQILMCQFQSRNRGSFDFKSPRRSVVCRHDRQSWFQSRNRGSFDFKSSGNGRMRQPNRTFQSRNRGSFDFKCRCADVAITADKVSIS